MPLCLTCGKDEACGESWYQLCMSCLVQQKRRIYWAALPIQTVARGFLARKLLQKHKAARRVQALWRGHLTRMQLALQ